MTENKRSGQAAPIPLPPPVQELIARLESRGYEAWAVGGCVRDTLMGRTPHDWDLCTSALPEQMKACFADLTVIETGLAHGTLTVRLDHESYEITTYRKDGAYTDHRRPDEVYFVGELEQDLSRRDFTINAMAAGKTGVVDLFGGQEDLKKGLIRCVGCPERRFEEDALRILRALRFAARFGFRVEEATAAAMLEKRELLRAVSAERIWAELCGLLVGQSAAAVIGQFTPVLEVVIPEITPCVGFEQHRPTHDRDVWGHILQAVSLSPPDLSLRWALLLHDLAKPECFMLDEEGVGHFPGHSARGAELAYDILNRLRADHRRRDEVVFLIKNHDVNFPATPKELRALLRQVGPETLQRWITVKRCDKAAHRAHALNERFLAQCDEFEALLTRVLAAPPLLGVTDLKLTGRDLLSLGVKPGPALGGLLRELFEEVEDGRLPNRRADLLRAAEKRIGAPKPEAPGD